MKKTSNRKKFELGQVIPLVALMMVAIIAMVALILDGGSIMSNRRTAQAAADAGALAGAKQLCLNKPAQAILDAETYVAKNGAAVLAEPTVVSGTLHVTANVTNSSFFAGIFGANTLTANAEAESGCYAPSGQAVVPLAWNCKSPTAEGYLDPGLGCKMETLSWNNLLRPLVEKRVTSIVIDEKNYSMDATYTSSITAPQLVNGKTMQVPPKQLYIIINSDKLCKEVNPSSALKCDLDGDGKLDIQTGGDRGWLYLTADSQLKQWILDNGPHPDFSLEAHKWLSGKSGDVESLYGAMISAGYQGQVVLIPVYNYLCAGDPRTDTSCVNAAHDPAKGWLPEPAGGDDFSDIRNKSTNYHIVTFDPFYVTCVSKSGGSTNGGCPGYQYAQTIGNNSTDLKNNQAMVEGFFLTDVEVTPDSELDCSINLGNCIVSLSK